MRIVSIVVLLGATLLFGVRTSHAAESLVTVAPGDTIDTFARQHLKNPRKWREVLSRNGLQASDFQPGLVLKIPRGMERPGDAVATLVEPSALVDRTLHNNWKQLSRGAKLFTGDRLKTNDEGLVHLILRNRMIVRIRQNTRVVLMDLTSEKAGALFLQEGRIRSFKQLPGRVSFKIVTPAAVVAVRGTDFTTEVEAGGRTRLSCFEGMVAVTAQGKSVNLPAGYSLTVEPGQPPGTLRKLPAPPALR